MLIIYFQGSRARALYKGGLRTPLAIAEASITEIEKALFESVSWTAQGETVSASGICHTSLNDLHSLILFYLLHLTKIREIFYWSKFCKKKI